MLNCWLLLVLVVVLWWDIRSVRRSIGVRSAVSVPWRVPRPTTHRPEYRGAVPPNRFAVVRWPDGHHFYLGCQGAQARQMYEHTHPATGEEVEFWELGDRRGHKAG